MAIITLNNNSLSSITSLPAGVGGKVLQVEKCKMHMMVTTTSSTYSSQESFSITPSSASSTKIYFQAFTYQLYGNNDTDVKVQ
jgi:hypothetical protein